MNQKEALQALLDSFSAELPKKVLICEWLEEINWHKESALFLQKAFTESESISYNKMERMHIALKKDSYTVKHYDYLLTNNLVNNEDEQDVQKLRSEGQPLILPQGTISGAISKDKFYDYCHAVEASRVFCNIYGWGIDCDALMPHHRRPPDIDIWAEQKWREHFLSLKIRPKAKA